MTVSNRGLIQHSALTSYTPTACRPVKVSNSVVSLAVENDISLDMMNYSFNYASQK